MTTIVSNVCRVKFKGELLEWADAQEAGITEIPQELLAPRQLKMKNLGHISAITFPTVAKWYRDAWISTVMPATAQVLVENKIAEYCTQSILIYGVEDYLADNDVASNLKEVKRAKDSGADKVIVAVIGENRSTLSVCRNIVSGCQKEDKLEEDAAGALVAASCFLIEDSIEENERATEALKAFKQQYPDATSGDLQTFIIGWRSCEELKRV